MNLLRENSESKAGRGDHTRRTFGLAGIVTGKVTLYYYLLEHITISPIGQLSITHHQKQKNEEQEQAR